MVYSYDSKAGSIIFGGNIISGTADGTFLTIERNEDMWALKVGSDGAGTRCKVNDYSGKITITLHQSSASNDVLSGICDADEKTGAGALPFFYRDASGRTVVSALTAWITKYPSVELANEVTDRVWVLETDNLQLFAAGN